MLSGSFLARPGENGSPVAISGPWVRSGLKKGAKHRQALPCPSCAILAACGGRLKRSALLPLAKPSLPRPGDRLLGVRGLRFLEGMGELAGFLATP